MTRGTSVSAARERAVYLTYRTLAEVMRALPEPLARAGAAAAGLGLTAFRGEERALYLRHLERVLGRPLGEDEAGDWTKRAFGNYARYWFEGARLPSTPPAVVRDRLTVESGYERFLEAMGLGRGAVMALPHVGSWEWGGAWLALQGYSMTSVAEPIEPRALYDFFSAQRRAMGLRIVPLDRHAGGVLLRTLRAGGLVGLLCDRDVVGNGIEVEFFGERTRLPGGPATLALRTGAALFPTAVYIGPGHMHTAVVLPPVDTVRTGSMRADVVKVTQALACALETLIRRAPDQWYVFQPNWPSDPGWSQDTGPSGTG